jgi:hypothetical protein
MAAREFVISLMEQVAKEQAMELAPLSEETTLDETGLDSLCWAVIFARLEAATGFDPFFDGSALPVRVGDVFKIYERALETATHVPHRKISQSL